MRNKEVVAPAQLLMAASAFYGSTQGAPHPLSLSVTPESILLIVRPQSPTPVLSPHSHTQVLQAHKRGRQGW